MFCYLLNPFEPVLYRLLLIHGRRLCKWLSPDINGKNIIILPHYALYIYLMHLNYLYHHVQIFLCLNVMDNFVCDICLILVPGFLMSFECLLCYYTVRCTYMSLLYCGFVLYCLSLFYWKYITSVYCKLVLYIRSTYILLLQYLYGHTSCLF